MPPEPTREHKYTLPATETHLKSVFNVADREAAVCENLFAGIVALFWRHVDGF